MDTFFTYILQSESTGMYYIGSTQNLDDRITQHNDPARSGKKTTRKFSGPWVLVYHETFETRSEAMRREKHIKSWKSRIAIANLISNSSR